VVLHGHALQPWMANALTSVPVPVLDPKDGAHRRGARWCMGGLHLGGLRLGEEGEHDECKELQYGRRGSSRTSHHVLVPAPIGAVCKAASMLLHAAAGAMACASEGKAARASRAPALSLYAHSLQRANCDFMAVQRVRIENKWRWELLGRAKTAVELAWRDSTHHAQACMQHALQAHSSWPSGDIATNLLSFHQSIHPSVHPFITSRLRARIFITINGWGKVGQ
jgi:hypothetical protein